jgi:hypothetical protein
MRINEGFQELWRLKMEPGRCFMLTKEARRLKIEPWRVCKPLVIMIRSRSTIRIRSCIKVKSRIQNRIKVKSWIQIRTEVKRGIRIRTRVMQNIADPQP